MKGKSPQVQAASSAMHRTSFLMLEPAGHAQSAGPASGQLGEGLHQLTLRSLASMSGPILRSHEALDDSELAPNQNTVHWAEQALPLPVTGKRVSVTQQLTSPKWLNDNLFDFKVMSDR